MLKIGLIGAGHIAANHINAYKKTGICEVVAIADINIENAKNRAEEFEIRNYYADYKELLKDESIDAVSIITPTFTHKEMVVAALKAGKHVLCEKPPMLNADEAKECEKVAKENGKLLMYAFVCRFHNSSQYLKKYIEAGKLGEVVSAECMRMSRCSASQSWFSSREKGGGALKDECIHEVDLLMYLMGYPKVRYVVANESFVNNDLPEKLNNGDGWVSHDKSSYERTIESTIEGMVFLDNGASIRVKCGKISNSLTIGRSYELTGSKAGVRCESNKIKMLELSDQGFAEKSPDIPYVSAFEKEIEHFADCIKNGTECIVKPSEAVALMEIIDGLYKSAETKQPVIF